MEVKLFYSDFNVFIQFGPLRIKYVYQNLHFLEFGKQLENIWACCYDVIIVANEFSKRNPIKSTQKFCGFFLCRKT